MLPFKQLQALANNSLAIWQRPEPLLTRVKLSWQYQQQCYRVLQQHVSACLNDLVDVNAAQQDQDTQIPPMVFTLQGLPGQTLASAFLLQNDQEVEVQFSLQLESIQGCDPSKAVTDHIQVHIQPAVGKLVSGGSEPIQISVQLDPELLPGDYLAVIGIHGFVEQSCHLQIEVKDS
jgi:hypothetical protein